MAGGHLAHTRTPWSTDPEPIAMACKGSNGKHSTNTTLPALPQRRFLSRPAGREARGWRGLAPGRGARVGPMQRVLRDRECDGTRQERQGRWEGSSHRSLVWCLADQILHDDRGLGFMGMDRQQGQNNSIGAIRRAQKHGLQRAMKREREKEKEIEKIK